MGIRFCDSREMFVPMKKDGTSGEGRPLVIDRERAYLARVGFALGLLCSGGLGLQRVLGLLHQTVKGNLVTNREIAEDLAVEHDVRGCEAFNESAVGHAGSAASGIESHDPKTAIIGLLLLAIDIRVLPRVLNGFFRVAEELGLISEIAAGVFQNFLMPLT